MTEGLHLTKREESVLHSIIQGQQPDPINQFFQHRFFKRRVVGLLGASAVVFSTVLIFGFIVYMVERAFGEGSTTLAIFLVMLVIEWVVDRCYRIPVRDEIIRKIYSVVDGNQSPALRQR